MLKYPYIAKKFIFPADEGRHNDANIEWWYFNAHAKTIGGDKYAFMVAYTMNHNKYFIVIDIDNKKCYSAKINDCKLEYSTEKHDLKYGGDSWKQEGDEAFTYKLHIKHEDMVLNLHMRSQKPPLVMGKNGKVPMGNGGPTYWYALPHLHIDGELILGDIKKSLHGTGWIDRQWGNWDWRGFGKWEWFSIQLSNNTDIAITRLYEPITQRALTSKFYISHPDHSVSAINEFKIKRLSQWKSQKSGETYPLGWTIRAQKRQIELTIEPRFNSQEVLKGFWEGSCSVNGTINGETVEGNAFVELQHGLEVNVFKKISGYLSTTIAHHFSF